MCKVQVAFEKLKCALQETVVLRYPDISTTFILDCDASNLIQVQFSLK